MRQSLRGLVDHLTQIGIPSGRVALEMQLTTSPGLGQRAGLEPPQAWFEMVKLEALAAKFVATQFKLQGIWSWGWATFSTTATPDPDKAAAACVWLWARDQSLCDGPTAAGAGFDASLTEGQLDVPAGDRCVDERRRDLAQRGRALHRAHRRPRLRRERAARGAHARLPGEGRLSGPALGRAGGDRRRVRRRPQRSTGPRSRPRSSRSATPARSSPPGSSGTRSRRSSRRRRPLARRSPTSSRPTATRRSGSSRRPLRRRGSAGSGRAGRSRRSRRRRSSRSPRRGRSTPRTGRSTSRRPAPRCRSACCRPPRRPPRPARRSAASRARRSTATGCVHEQALLATASCLNDQVPTAEETDLSSFVPFLFPAA